MTWTVTQSFLAACPKGRVANDNRRPQCGPSGTPLKNTSQITRSPNGRNGAYTLIEVLIVAVIVVLMLGMALPVFRAITGSRSEAGAANIIAGMLGRARTDAIGLDKTMGVAFLYNPSTQLSYMAEVEFPAPSAWVGTSYVPPYGYFYTTFNTTNFYFVNAQSTQQQLSRPPTNNPTAPSWAAAVGGPPLDIRANTDLVSLPAGVGVQTICNCNFTTGTNPQRTTDGYLSVGVILFDGHGRLVGQNYGISASSRLMAMPGLTPTDYPTTNQNIGTPYVASTWPRFFGVQSQFGLVVYQQEAFNGQKSPTPDPAYTTVNTGQQNVYTSTGSPTQQSEENWLDQNATPLLIDRYTGTLIKAE